jgi:hypothetical protein
VLFFSFMLLQEVPPFNPLAIVLDLVGFLLKLLGLGGPNMQLITDAINGTWGNLVIGLGFVYNVIRDVLEFLKNLIQIIYRGLVHIISDILHGHLLDALHDIQKLFHAIHDLFAPIINFIQKLRGWFYQYIYPWIKLVQNILSVIRAFLAAFRVIGVKWAAKLDADIARIQGYLTTALQDIVGTLNQASTWLNFMTDPTGIFRKGFFNNTLFNSMQGLTRALSFGKDRYLSASEAANTQGDKAMISGGATVLTRNADGSVTYSDASARINKNLDAAWTSYVPNIPPH